MAVTVKLEPISRDIALLLSEVRGGEAQSKLFASLAQDLINEAKEQNRSILGNVPPFKQFVDGRLNAPLQSVRPNGVIAVEFLLIGDVLRWIGEQLVLHSPFRTGHYQKSHILLADGTQIDPDTRIVPEVDEYVFINTVAYARKIERGSSSEAPDGVYQAVAVLARRRFNNVAKVSFGYRTIAGGQRNPAIIVTTGTRH